MVYKIKAFISYSADEMERKISSWLEKEKEIEIIEVSQSQNTEGDIVVLIFYRDKTNKDINKLGQLE